MAGLQNTKFSNKKGCGEISNLWREIICESTLA